MPFDSLYRKKESAVVIYKKNFSVIVIFSDVFFFFNYGSHRCRVGSKVVFAPVYPGSNPGGERGQDFFRSELVRKNEYLLEWVAVCRGITSKYALNSLAKLSCNEGL